MLKQYYPNLLMSPEDGGGGAPTPESYDEKCEIDGKVYEVHVENGADGQPIKVTPKADYEGWGTPILNDKLNADLVHKAKKSQEVLKNNNDSNRALKEYEDRIRKLEEEKIRTDGIIETLQRVAPPAQEKPKAAEKDDFDVVSEAYRLAGVTDEDDWDSLTPTQRFKAESKANQKLLEHNQMKFMKQINETTSQANQQFVREQKLSTMLVNAGIDPQKAKAEMEQNGVIYSEQGVNFYLQHMKLSTSKPEKPKDAIDELNKRQAIIDKVQTTEQRNAATGYQFVTPKDRKLQAFAEAVKNSNVDKNQLARDLLSK